MLTLLLAASLAHAKPTASSVADDDLGKHAPDLALDGLLSTGWAEGGVGHGDGSWWEFDLAQPTKLEVVSFWGGNLSNGKKSFREYARPKRVRLFVDGVQQGDKDEEGNFKGFRLQDEMKRIDIPVDVAAARKVRIEVAEVFEGRLDVIDTDAAAFHIEGVEALADDAEIGALAPPRETLPLRDQQFMGHVRVGHDDHAAIHDSKARNAAVAERQIGHEEMRRPRKRRSGPQERKSCLLMHARHLHLPCVPPLLARGSTLRAACP